MDTQTLLAKHPYYCSESNYHSNESSSFYESANSFWSEWENADEDLNLLFRWDVSKEEDEPNYTVRCFFILQRKGNFNPCTIQNVTEEELEKFYKYFEGKWVKIKELWAPFSNQ